MLRRCYREPQNVKKSVLLTRFEIGRRISSMRGVEGLRINSATKKRIAKELCISEREVQRAFDAFHYADDALHPNATIAIRNSCESLY